MLRNLTLALGLLATPALSAGIEITVAGEANGVIKIDLLEDLAPLHAERIMTLASEGYYDDVYFHRVMSGFMAQTGDGQFGKASGGQVGLPGTGGSSYPNLKAEFSDVRYERGVVGMARTPDVNSANSQFFIMFAPYPPLNGNYTVVGRVIEGMDVVDDIKLGLGENGAVLGEPDRMVTVVATD